MVTHLKTLTNYLSSSSLAQNINRELNLKSTVSTWCLHGMCELVCKLQVTKAITRKFLVQHPLCD